LQARFPLASANKNGGRTIKSRRRFFTPSGKPDDAAIDHH